MENDVNPHTGSKWRGSLIIYTEEKEVVMTLANGFLYIIIKPGRKTSPSAEEHLLRFLGCLTPFCQSVWFPHFPQQRAHLQCESNKSKKTLSGVGWVEKPRFNGLSVTFTLTPAEGAKDQRPKRPSVTPSLAENPPTSAASGKCGSRRLAAMVGSRRTNHHVVIRDLLTPQGDLRIWCHGGGKQKLLCVITTC